MDCSSANAREVIKSQVDNLIKLELKSMAPKLIEKDDAILFEVRNKEHLQHPADSCIKHNDLLREEMKRVGEGKGLTAIDTVRFRLEFPKSTGKEGMDDAWSKAVQNAHAQLEHKQNQVLNLELINKFGTNAWMVHNHQLESLITKLQAEVDLQKQILEDINKERKTDQLKVGFTLSTLENRWAQLVDQCFQVDIACSMLDAEIAVLRDGHSQ
ncbi:hypothetical protein HDU97_003287 [Phlyctochytrium planicorne]|nr:hypothetical protein HDU97_003287 [Phlyctochytrium planicorne]